jgi:hypothetical protein
MKNRSFLIATVLSAGLALHSVPSRAADNIAADALTTASAPISKEAVADPRVAATGFVEHVNYARVALAMKHIDLAKRHITQARNMATLIKGVDAERRRVAEVESCRIVYHYDTEYKSHYFPIRTGPVQVKQMSDGPLWAENELAVADADVVYLTLDLTGDKAEAYLKDAETAITAGNFKEADAKLAKLIETTVLVDNRVSVPNDKARDNIALARNFIAGKNYEGARYALKHADAALDEMLNDGRYAAHRSDVIAMRLDVSELQGHIAKKDPTMIEKADAKLEKWRDELKKWSAGDK